MCIAQLSKNVIMQTVKPATKEISILGVYAYARCENCGESRGNWFSGLYGYIDCQCKDGRKYRTEVTLTEFGLK